MSDTSPPKPLLIYNLETESDIVPYHYVPTRREAKGHESFARLAADAAHEQQVPLAAVALTAGRKAGDEIIATRDFVGREGEYGNEVLIYKGALLTGEHETPAAALVAAHEVGHIKDQDECVGALLSHVHECLWQLREISRFSHNGQDVLLQRLQATSKPGETMEARIDRFASDVKAMDEFTQAALGQLRQHPLWTQARTGEVWRDAGKTADEWEARPEQRQALTQICMEIDPASDSMWNGAHRRLRKVNLTRTSFDGRATNHAKIPLPSDAVRYYPRLESILRSPDKCENDAMDMTAFMERYLQARELRQYAVAIKTAKGDLKAAVRELTALIIRAENDPHNLRAWEAAKKHAASLYAPHLKTHPPRDRIEVYIYLTAVQEKKRRAGFREQVTRTDGADDRSR